MPLSVIPLKVTVLIISIRHPFPNSLERNPQDVTLPGSHPVGPRRSCHLLRYLLILKNHADARLLSYFKNVMFINFDPKDISMDNSLKVPLIKYLGEGAGGGNFSKGKVEDEKNYIVQTPPLLNIILICN